MVKTTPQRVLSKKTHVHVGMSKVSLMANSIHSTGTEYLPLKGIALGITASGKVKQANEISPILDPDLRCFSNSADFQLVSL